jgi:hypothetical protein
MKTKREMAKELISQGQVDKALKLVAKFPFKKHEELGQKIQDAKDALLNPSFYKQMKKDPNKIYKEGIDALFQFLN